MSKFDEICGTYEPVVVKYCSCGHQVIIIDCWTKPYSKKEINEYVEKYKEKQKIITYLQIQKKEGASFFTFVFDQLANGMYSDIPYMTMEEFEEKIKYYPYVYTLDKKSCSKLCELDGNEYWTNKDTKNKINIFQLHKIDNANLIVIDYVSKPLIMSHVDMFKKNNFNLTSYSFKPNTKATLQKYSR